MEGRFEIHLDEGGSMRFQLIGPSGVALLKSEPYKTLAGCVNGIGSCREHSQFERFFRRSLTTDGKHALYLRAANNRIIGLNENCGTTQEVETVIRAIMKLARDAEIKNFTE